MPEFKLIPVDKIHQLTPSVRKYRDEQWVDFLAQDIAKNGVQTPIHVVEIGEFYSPIDGWHRARAAGKAGLKEIPAFVWRQGEVDAELLSFRLNMLQRSLDPISIAEFIRTLRFRRNWTWQQITGAIGLSERHCRRFLELLALPEEVQREIGLGLRPAFEKEPKKHDVGHFVRHGGIQGSSGVRCPICGSFPSKGAGYWIYICRKHADEYEEIMRYIAGCGWKQK